MIIEATGYDRIDGKNAYHSPTKRLTVGFPTLPENISTPVALQLWQQGEDGGEHIKTELPMHQVLDLAILLSRTLLHFRDAYRYPALYDPSAPVLDRLGLQGDAATISVCTENPRIDEDMRALSQAFSDLGELTGERLRTLKRILDELD